MKAHPYFRLPILRSFATVLIFGLAVSCGSGDASSTTVPSDESSFPPHVEPYNPKIDPDDFVAGIDNLYMPLESGTTYIYEGTSDGEHEMGVVSVTRRTKTILGIECTVVKDVVRTDGEIAEKTFDWFAQDRYGNVWYFGEDSYEYENGKPINHAGSWEAGVDGALPGIVMLADPQAGDRYRQEYYAGEAEDFGQVLQLDASVEVPAGAYDSVLITKDWTPLEAAVVENKYYAPGVGLVLERAVKGGNGELELVRIKQP